MNISDKKDSPCSSMSGAGNGVPRMVRVGGVMLGGNCPLALIAGPCVIESEIHARDMAENLRRLCERLRLPLIFKASYDKANRSSISSYRGPGLQTGLRILAAIRRDCGVPVLTDVHSADEVEAAAEIVDAIQIPAFLCRQTDLLLAAGRSGKPVNIKKGQFLAPWDVVHLIEKVESTGNRDIILTERGTAFGYNNLVSDMRSLPLMRRSGVPVVFDATHSAQLPGGQGRASGGDRAMAMVLARAAVAVGVDALFLETHDQPDKALCDGPNMIALADLESLLRTVQAIDAIMKKAPAPPTA